MKKTVQVVMLPTKNKSSFIYKYDEDYYHIKKNQVVFEEFNPYSTSIAQQLLVLSDDVTSEGDLLHSYGKIYVSVGKNNPLEHENSPKKIIGSYPQIEGTLPISKETVQAWINVGTPVDASVEIKHKSIGRNTIGTTPAGEPIKMNSFIETPKLDSQGNLLLEFDKKEEPVVIKKTRNVGTSFDHLPSIPIDEKISIKAAEYAESQHTIPTDMLNSIDQYDIERVAMIEQAIEESKSDYLSGYKQALKDLGISK